LACDFDGTITDVDTGELILSKFAKGDWRRYDELYDRGEMPMEETMRRQFTLVKGATKASMIKLVDVSVRIRPSFEELLAACDSKGVPVAIVSYGLDFIIEHILGKFQKGQRVKVYAPRTRVTPDGIHFAFPRLRLKGSANMKDDVVGYYKRRGFRVAFVGDGTSDYAAIRHSDTRFAIAGSRLAGLCRNRRVECSLINDFGPVVEALAA